MKLTNESNESIRRAEMEMVENEKQEYKFFGKFLRRKGLNLYAYDPIKGEIYEVEKREIKTAEIDFSIGGIKNLSTEEAVVNSNHDHFEALNMKNAKKRLKKFIDGDIKELTNLRPINSGMNINTFK